MEDALRITYLTQSAHRILLLFGTFKANEDLEETAEAIKGIKADPRTIHDGAFRVECIREGEHAYRSVDVAGAVTKHLSKLGVKTDLKVFDLIIQILIEGDKGYYGLDLSGRDLSKRDYKIFQTTNTPKGTLAYMIARISGYDSSKVLLDPFCGAGMVPIEAALYALKFPVRYYSKDKFPFAKLIQGDIDRFFEKADKHRKKSISVNAVDSQLRLIRFAQKNAKIAGVSDSMAFSRQNLEWLDTRFDERSVDIIATFLPSSREFPQEKMMHELFYQARYVLRKGGSITVAEQDNSCSGAEAGKNGFSVAASHEIYSGQQKVIVTRYSG